MQSCKCCRLLVPAVGALPIGGVFGDMMRFKFAWLTLAANLLATVAFAAETQARQLAREFTTTVRPFLEANCLGCHGPDQPKAKLNLGVFSSLEEVEHGERTWSMVLERLEAKEMPPEEAKHQPTADQRQVVVDWIRAVRKSIADTHAGDPGEVLARRLSNAEYDYTIRDLTGVDIRPTQEFPVDPANEAGFDNSGESLSMSPALLKKYLEAARHVSEYIVFKPQGFTFAPFPVVTDTDRDKYCVNRIVQFYQRQPTDLAEYFRAAWRYKNRAALGMPDATLADVAFKSKVSPKYLPKVWAALAESPDEVGPLARLQSKWQALPEPNAQAPFEASSVLAGCQGMRDWVLDLRERIQFKIANLVLKGVGPGSQPFVLWKDRQYAEKRMTYDHGVLQIEGDPKSGRQVPAEKTNQPEFPSGDEERGRVAMQPAPRDPELTIPADETNRAKYEAAFERFASTFPDAFYISERGRIFLDRPKDKQDKGRLLSAGFHSMMGYFRDDTPLCELILDGAGKREIDELWTELDFITEAPQRQHTGYIWYERAESATIRRWGPEFDEFRSEDKDITSEARLEKFSKMYLAKARESYAANGGDAVALEVLDDFFKSVNKKVRWLEGAKLASEPSHLKSLLDFADRAYRRPLSPAERDSLMAFYHQLRETDGLSHEDAIRDTLASILISPNFCYRIVAEPSPSGRGLGEGAGTTASAGTLTPTLSPREREQGSQQLGDYALASRLSYFLWSSMPDEELRQHAAAGDLHKPEILLAQAKRMIQDDHTRALAVEFGGNWLDFRRFEEHNSVDRNRFPEFTNELRQAMFEEPIRFFLNVVQHDQSVLDFLYGDYTFVNPVLAKHYGMPTPNALANEWTRVDGISQYGRGGLPTMAVFLTKNAPGLRTSPVKRGYWVVRRLLGEVIPPPPPNVPVLPADETKLGDLTLPQTMARHREDKNCSVCHEKFDSLGLVFEGFGPVGERRAKDLAGRPVENSATFPDGSEGTGLEGLQRYVRQRRENDFLDNLCRKLLSYALGRTLIVSDDPAVQKMKEQLAANDNRFSTLLETIVTSPQFLTKRGDDEMAKN
jgi:mono/diheme cytochrome c family protein